MMKHSLEMGKACSLKLKPQFDALQACPLGPDSSKIHSTSETAHPSQFNSRKRFVMFVVVTMTIIIIIIIAFLF